jgi:protein-L-isoaspartate(D-aspartate) O-methyltransferase
MSHSTQLVVTLQLALMVALWGCREQTRQDAAPQAPTETNMPASPPPAAPALRELDPPEAQHRRDRLFDEIARREPWDGVRWDSRVLDVMRRVPRHLFVPKASLDGAYRDAPHAIGLGQTISQPTIVAMMTQALELRGDERVLEIGTGSGYQAAVLARMTKQVYSIELHAPLADAARDRLAELGFANVEVRAGDGYAGWLEHAPFDRIILTAAPDELPKALVEQLAEGGILVAPVGPEGQVQRLLRYRKVAGKLVQEDLGGVLFVPMVKSDDEP